MQELTSANHKEKKHIKSHWKFLSYLLAIPHSKSLLKSLKSTCINSRTPSTRSEIQMLTTSSWIRKSVELTLKCISRKTTGLDRLRESRAQILWSMYNMKNVYYVALLWEDFMYQADNREISSARKEHMPY
ncbi:hypothetical protein Tco_0602343 [Tanacetum coccineum]